MGMEMQMEIGIGYNADPILERNKEIDLEASKFGQPISSHTG